MHYCFLECYSKPIPLCLWNCTLSLGFLSFRRMHFNSISRCTTGYAACNAYSCGYGVLGRRIHSDCNNAKLSSVSGLLASRHLCSKHAAPGNYRSDSCSSSHCRHRGSNIVLHNFFCGCGGFAQENYSLRYENVNQEKVRKCPSLLIVS